MMKTQKGVSRRDFLKATGVLAGSALLSACSSVFEISPSPTPTFLPTSTNTPIPTNTSTPTPSATSVPTETAIPMKEYSIPLRDDGEFDWSKIEEYPQLTDLNLEPGGDLYNFIEFCKRKGLFRDYTKGPVTELALYTGDARESKDKGNWRCVFIRLNPNTPVPQGTEPVHKVAGAKFSVIHDNEWVQENMFVQLQQFYVPDAPGKSILAITVDPDQMEQRGYIVNLNKPVMYMSIRALFADEVLNGTSQFRAAIESNAFQLHKLGLTQAGDAVAEKIMVERRIIPEADRKIFMGAVSPIMVVK